MDTVIFIRVHTRTVRINNGQRVEIAVMNPVFGIFLISHVKR